MLGTFGLEHVEPPLELGHLQRQRAGAAGREVAPVVPAFVEVHMAPGSVPLLHSGGVHRQHPHAPARQSPRHFLGFRSALALAEVSLGDHNADITGLVGGPQRARDLPTGHQVKPHGSDGHTAILERLTPPQAQGTPAPGNARLACSAARSAGGGPDEQPSRRMGRPAARMVLV